MTDDDLMPEIEATGERLVEARRMIARRIIGQEAVVEETLIAILCGGHGLLVGAPGLAKTRLVETLVDRWLVAHPDHPALPHLEDDEPAAVDGSQAEANAALDATDPGAIPDAIE